MQRNTWAADAVAFDPITGLTLVLSPRSLRAVKGGVGRRTAYQIVGLEHLSAGSTFSVFATARPLGSEATGKA